MPRIKAALALVAIGVFCIGFNALRYRAVWEMVAAASSPGRAGADTQVAGVLPGLPSGAATPAEGDKPPAAAISGTPSGETAGGDSASKKIESLWQNAWEEPTAALSSSDGALKKAKGAGSKPAEAAKSGPSKPSKPSDNKGKKPETRPKPGDPSKEKKRASSTEPSRSATARSGTAATRDSDGPACTEDACKLPEATPESPARKDEQIFGAESFKSAESSKPVEMTPEPRYGSPSGYSSPGYNDTSSATAERPWSGDSEKRNDPPMVPVVPNSFSVPDVGAGGTSQFSGTAWGGAKQVRRLPLAGQDAATAGETARDLADEAVPVYPVTQAK